MASPSVNSVPPRLVTLVALAVVVRVVMVFVIPPLVDVYYYDSQAVSALVTGVDPYGHLYSRIPSWLATEGAQRVYAYLPGVVLFLAPFGAFLDIRLGLVAADVMVAWSLFALGGRKSRAAALAFFLAPWAFLFSTSYANNTLVAMAFFGVFLVAEVRGRMLLASLSLGVSLASSQFVWLVFPFLLVRYVRERRLGYAVASLAVAALILLPFALWDYGSFVYDTVVFQFARPVQGLVTPEAFGLNFNPTLSGLASTAAGVSVPLLIRVVLAAAALGALLFKTRDLRGLLLNASAFILVAIFLLADDFSWWYLELPFQVLLAALAFDRGGGSASHANA
ncbi:MAG TPA: hypothetical protein VKF15_06400 [Nitrososphaerales archaeon]|nr:hypothetical protein [Nitrososphaerales archaeon]